MFTGLIEEVGTVERLTPRGGTADLVIRAARILTGVAVGDSIAVNGPCLTVTALGDGTFTAQAVAETLRRTNLGAAARGTRVNLERALSLGDRLGGHLVQGHIDATGTVTAVRGGRDNAEITVSHPSALGRYVAEKGSVAMDGVSLTVAAIGAGMFTVSIIAHTLASTTLGGLRPGDTVNLEMDVIAKYVERLTLGRTGGLTLEGLEAAGF